MVFYPGGDERKMNVPFSIRSSAIFHNGFEREKNGFLMRIKVVLGIWLLGITRRG